MSILATKVGQLPEAHAPGTSVCPRCGITFDRSRERVIAGAPCKDCRAILRAEGDTTVWNSRRTPKTGEPE